jgi:hypothetical protein
MERHTLTPPNRNQRVEELGVYEMIWDCKFCGSANLPAKTHKFCPNCGAAQDPDTRRFPSDEEKIAVQNYVARGADLICASCSTPNAGDAKFCQQCGAPLENATRAQTVASERKREGDKFENGAERNVDQERFESEMRRVGVTQTAAKSSNRTLYIALGAVALVVIAILVAVFWKRESSVYVAGHEWERTIAIEEFRQVDDQAWCDSMPSDAYGVSRRREQRSTRRVQDGESCEIERVDQGDGTFREQRVCSPTYREEPVYDDRCYFTVDRWQQVRTVDASGMSLDDAPVWPQTNIRRSGSCLGCQREGNRDESYVLVLQVEDRQYRCEVLYDAWQNAPIESTWTLQVSVVTGQPDCGSLQRAG